MRDFDTPSGIASGGHLAGEICEQAAGIDVVHVSYKGGNVAMMDVVANQIPLVHPRNSPL